METLKTEKPNIERDSKKKKLLLKLPGSLQGNVRNPETLKKLIHKFEVKKLKIEGDKAS